MNRLIIALITLCVVGTGCSKIGRPTYDLIIGDTTVTLPVHKDPLLIQNDLMAHLMPLWNELKTGVSPIFSCVRVINDHEFAAGYQAKAEAMQKDVIVSSTRTYTIGMVRFFKNRSGTNGMEQVDSSGNVSPMIYGESLGWESIENYLREQNFSLELIQNYIMVDWNQQTN